MSATKASRILAAAITGDLTVKNETAFILIIYVGGVRVGWLGSLAQDRLNLGISYQSKLYMTDLDAYEGLFAGGGEFDVPAILSDCSQDGAG